MQNKFLKTLLIGVCLSGTAVIGVGVTSTKAQPSPDICTKVGSSYKVRSYNGRDYNYGYDAFSVKENAEQALKQLVDNAFAALVSEKLVSHSLFDSDKEAWAAHEALGSQWKLWEGSAMKIDPEIRSVYPQTCWVPLKTGEDITNAYAEIGFQPVESEQNNNNNI